MRSLLLNADGSISACPSRLLGLLKSMRRKPTLSRLLQGRVGRGKRSIPYQRRADTSDATSSYQASPRKLECMGPAESRKLGL